MDIGKVVSWIQAVMWILALALWLGRVLRGETQMHPLIQKAFSSNGVIGVVILLGLMMSAISLYRLSTLGKYAAPFDVKKFNALKTDLEEVDGKHFINEAVEIDNRKFSNCTFTNVRFVYRGLGPMTFISNKFEGLITLDIKHNQGLVGLVQLQQEFKQLSPSVQIDRTP